MFGLEIVWENLSGRTCPGELSGVNCPVTIATYVHTCMYYKRAMLAGDGRYIHFGKNGKFDGKKDLHRIRDNLHIPT